GPRRHRAPLGGGVPGVPDRRASSAVGRPGGIPEGPAVMTEVKICGLTRSEDVLAACELGASILGFNFVAASPRRLSIGRAREISAAAPATVLRAGVFATESRDEVVRAVREIALQLVQLHRPVCEEDLEGL